VSKAGNDRAYDLPRFKITHKDRTPGPAGVRPPGFEKALEHRADFSFSGLKTAVLRHVRAHEGPMSESTIADVSASFQRIVVSTLIDRLFEAARRYQAKSVGVAGGVSANSRLRSELQERGARREIPAFLPSLMLSTDNAAMIAAAGLRRFRAGVTAALDLNADAALTL
jgi:N6-L-threonylcarbamoyladenine synthase